MKKERQVYILVTSVIVGILIFSQAKTFTSVNAVNRDTRADVFRELMILKNGNSDLEDEIADLESQLSKTSNQEDALKGIETDIDKFQMLNGHVSVKGPGISLTLNGNIKAIWLTDTVNELFAAGAETISINEIRLTNQTSGFDTIPNGQILLNGSIIKTPYHIQAIGDKTVLDDSLNQPQGIIQRLKQSYPDLKIALEQKDLITMEKVI